MQIAIFSSILLVIVVIILSYYALLRKKHAAVLKENYNTINRQKLLLEENLKQLAEDEKKLQKLNATKDKFFSIIAHDLKNPFNVMIGISDLMRSNADLKNSKEFESFNRRYVFRRQLQAITCWKICWNGLALKLTRYNSLRRVFLYKKFSAPISHYSKKQLIQRISASHGQTARKKCSLITTW